jgi:hypothetical protein
MITCRQITPEDMPTLKRWAERRGCVLDERLLSPHGFVSVNSRGDLLICAWAALVMSVPIVQVDHVYVPRRFKADEVREGWAALVSAVQAWVKLINERSGFGYNLIEIVMNPVMEKEVLSHGGQVSLATYKKAHYLIN